MYTYNQDLKRSLSKNKIEDELLLRIRLKAFTS